MKKNHCYSANLDLETEKLFKEAVFLGQGNNGIVYRLPQNKIIKLFTKEKVWKDEASILLKTKQSKFFPKVYSIGRLYIVREMIEGIQLDKYIKKKGLDENIVRSINELTDEFIRLKFTKIDSRCKDLYIGYDNKIRVIDPKKCYKRKVKYPRHLMKGLLRLEVLDEFLFFLEKIDKNKARNWEKCFDKYLKLKKNK